MPGQETFSLGSLLLDSYMRDQKSQTFYFISPRPNCDLNLLGHQASITRVTLDLGEKQRHRSGQNSVQLKKYTCGLPKRKEARDFNSTVIFEAL